MVTSPWSVLEAEDEREEIDEPSHAERLSLQSVCFLFCTASFPAQLVEVIHLTVFLLDTTHVHRYVPFFPRCMPPVTASRVDSLDFSGGFKSCNVD